MSTTPVLSLTDELVAELEAAATDSKLNIYRPHGWAHSVRCGNHLQTDFDFLSPVSPSVVLALLAEREELKRDAARYRWLIRQAWFQSAMDRYDIDDGGMQAVFEAETARIIDAAMQS